MATAKPHRRTLLMAASGHTTVAYAPQPDSRYGLNPYQLLSIIHDAIHRVAITSTTSTSSCIHGQHYATGIVVGHSVVAEA